MSVWKRQNSKGKSQIRSGAEHREQGLTTKGHKRTSGGDGDSLYLVLLGIQLNRLVKLIDL